MVKRFAGTVDRPVARPQRLILTRRGTVGPPRMVHFSANCFTLPGMNNDHKRTATALIKAVALLQLKVLLGAARDLVLGPTALVAALADLILLQMQEPRLFRAILRFGERSDAWIDVWSAGRLPGESPRENVEALLDRVEEVVRDPHTGARRARVLKRWAERQLARARQRAAVQLSARLTSTPDRAATPPKDSE